MKAEPIKPDHNYMNNYTLAGLNARYTQMLEIVQRVYPECPASELSRVAYELSDNI